MFQMRYTITRLAVIILFLQLLHVKHDRTNILDYQNTIYFCNIIRLKVYHCLLSRCHAAAITQQCKDYRCIFVLPFAEELLGRWYLVNSAWHMFCQLLMMYVFPYFVTSVFVAWITLLLYFASWVFFIVTPVGSGPQKSTFQDNWSMFQRLDTVAICPTNSVHMPEITWSTDAT